MKKLEKYAEVNVAKLKNELSTYLRLVKEGHTVVVTEHKVSIAKVVPLDEKLDSDLVVVKARKPPRYLKEMSARRGTSKTNSLAGLLADRQKR